MRDPREALGRAVRDLEDSLGMHPEHPDKLQRYALAQAALGDLDAALDALQRALRAQPDFVAALVDLAWLHVRRDEPGVFQTLLRGRRGSLLPDAERRHLECLAAWRWQGAAQALERLGPPTGQRLDDLARLYLTATAGDGPALIATLADVLQRRPYLRRHLEALGLPGDVGSAAAGTPVPADARLQHAWAIWAQVQAGNPHYDALWRHVAALAPAEAVAERDAALHWSVAVCFDDCGWWLAVGEGAERADRDEDAEIAYRRAHDANPERVEPLLRLAYVFGARGDDASAGRVLQQAAREHPDFADVRYLLGAFHQDHGRDLQAEKEFRAALSANPTYLLPRIALGILLAKQHRDSEAVQLLEAVRRDGVASADVEATLAALYERVGAGEAAVEARKRAAALTARQD